MTLILYADFTSPGCYLAGLRADALAAAGADIDRRAVEHHPELPVTGRPLGSHDGNVLEERLAKLEALLLPGERLPWVLPKAVSNTMAAVSAFAEAYGAGVGADVRRPLFRLYWVDGVIRA